MRGVNLIPNHRIEARRYAAHVRRWVMACACYATMLGMAWGAARFMWPDARVALADEIASLQAKAQQDQATMHTLQPQLTQAYSTLAATRSIGDQPDWSYLTALVARALGDDAVLQALRLTPAWGKAGDAGSPARITQYKVQLEGFGRSQAAVLNYVRILEETRLFESVTLLETRGEVFHSQPAIAFRIECLFGDTAKGHTP